MVNFADVLRDGQEALRPSESRARAEKLRRA
jgi:hypothetical protein